MKMKVLLCAGIFMATPLSAEYKGNPDRFTSIGINYQGYSVNGDITVKGGPLSVTQNANDSGGSFALDVRIPVSNDVTITGNIGYLSSKSTAEETSVLLGQVSKGTGASFGVGIRFYLKDTYTPENAKYRPSDEEKYTKYMLETRKYNAAARFRGDREIRVMDFEEWLGERKKDDGLYRPIQ